MRFFNTEGPVRPDDHYCLPPLSRWDLDEILSLVDQKKYFLLHAPRQTGKTTCLLALMEHLNRDGRYRAVYANLEGAQAWRERLAEAIATIVTDIANSAQVWLGDEARPRHAQEVLSNTAPGSALSIFLSQWCQRTPQPLVLLLDEVDALIGDTLISLLRQLRAGYPQRPQAFPQTVVLCGVRDLR
ncbi:ATP-binding protein, partial [Thiococcus pfennigii]